jgi:hypothetical protein
MAEQMTDEKLRAANNARTAKIIELAKEVGLGNAIKIVDSDDSEIEPNTLDQLAFQLARRQNPEGRLTEQEIRKAKAILNNILYRFGGKFNRPTSSGDSLEDKITESELIKALNKGRGTNDAYIAEIQESLDKITPESVADNIAGLGAYAKGGRILKQTGGITETRTLPPEYVEALGKTYAADLTRQAGIPSITTATAQQPGETAEQFAQRQAQAQQFGITRAGMAELAPQVAAQDALQAAAYTQATDPTTGLGSFQPFLTKATTAADAATALTGPMTAAQTTAYMSPYQQQVIDATLDEFDEQAKRRRNQLAATTLGIPGAFGGGREGVQRAEFDATSDRNRAAIQSNLLQQGFQQAQSARQQDLANQQAIANQQRGLGAAAQDFTRAQIAGLGTLGAQQQAQNQAILDAQRQAAQMAVDDPRRRLAMLGQGVAGLSGLGTVQIGEAPAAAQASPLTTALGLGLAGADIYGRIFGGKR